MCLKNSLFCYINYPRHFVQTGIPCFFSCKKFLCYSLFVWQYLINTGIICCSHIVFIVSRSRLTFPLWFDMISELLWLCMRDSQKNLESFDSSAFPIDGSKREVHGQMIEKSFILSVRSMLVTSMKRKGITHNLF